MSLRAPKSYDRKTQKRCIKCRKWKDRAGPNKRFGNHESSSDGLQSICYDCKNLANTDARNKNVTARIRHHMSTRCMTQLGDSAPEGFTKDMEKYLGYKIGTLVKHLRKDLAEREGKGVKLRDRLNEGYHIDHLKPLMLFPVVNPETGVIDWDVFQECWDIENLSAIPASENLAKGAKYDHPEENVDVGSTLTTNTTNTTDMADMIDDDDNDIDGEDE